MKTKEQKNVCKYTKKKLTQLKSKNGITLIALVVTIIVLIILAGVSISLVLGDNGIVTKSKEVKQNMQVAGPVRMQFSYNGSTTIDCKNSDTNSTTDETQMTNANIKTTGQYYWLASRYVDSYSYGCNFRVNIVHSGGFLTSSILCNVESNGNAYGDSKSEGLRPCFSLKSDIKITGGDGKKAETSYVMRYLEEKMQCTK